MKSRNIIPLVLALLFFSAIASAQSLQGVASNPVGGNISATSSNCSVIYSCLWQNALPINAGTTSVNVSGTFSATLTVEVSNAGSGGPFTSLGTITSPGTTTYSTNG